MRGDVSNEQLESHVYDLLDELQRTAVTTGSDNPTWVTISNPRRETGIVTASSQGLYDGQLGIGLAVAAAETVFDLRPPVTVDDILSPLVGANPDYLIDSQHLGIGQGLGGYVYGFTKLAEFTGEPQYRKEAMRYVRLLRSRFEDTVSLDVMHGLSGSVLSLLALESHLEAEGVTDCSVVSLLDVASDSLASRVQSAMATEQTDTAVDERGFAHGAAGIGYALATAGERLDSPDYVETATRLFDYDMRSYDEERNNWQTTKEGELAYVSSWCRGRIGSTLTRAASHAATGSPDRGQFSPALQCIADRESSLPGDTLCHGEAGRLDALLTIGRMESDPALIAEATNGLREFVRADVGSYDLDGQNLPEYVRPGLFTGTSGVIYTICRFSDEAAVPEVTLFR